MTFEDRLARALRESIEGDLPPDFAARVRQYLPPQRRVFGSMWMRPLFSFAAGAAAVLALVAVVWLVSRPARSVDLGATATPTSSPPAAAAYAGLPPLDASDPRLAACGGGSANAISGFAVKQASDISIDFPHMGRAPELDVGTPAYVVVFKTISPFGGSGGSGAGTFVPRTSPRPGTHDVCVWLGDADTVGGQPAGEPNVYSDVDVSDFGTGVPSSAPPVTAPPSTTATPPDGQPTPTPRPSVTARPPASASPEPSAAAVASPWEIVSLPIAPDRNIYFAVTEASCASGMDAFGRIAQPEVVYAATTITITVRVHPLAGPQDCQGNPATPYQVELSEPISGRTLLDGSVSPASPAPTVAFGPVAASWRLLRVPEASDRALDVMVSDATCGGPPRGEILTPSIAYGASTITVTIKVQAPLEQWACQEGPQARYAVELTEPVNGRRLLDGGVAPPAPAATPYPGPTAPPPP